MTTTSDLLLPSCDVFSNCFIINTVHFANSRTRNTGSGFAQLAKTSIDENRMLFGHRAVKGNYLGRPSFLKVPTCALPWYMYESSILLNVIGIAHPTCLLTAATRIFGH